MDSTLTLPGSRTVGFATYGSDDGTPVVWCHGGPGSRLEPAAGHQAVREPAVTGRARGPVRRWPLADFFDGLETAELKLQSIKDKAADTERSLVPGRRQRSATF